jgi:beta-lactamase regulating signal transducer with metallopeptidase domain
MEILSNIPTALLNNIGFMAILFIIYESLKWVYHISPARLFAFGTAIQVISLLHFILSILAPTYFSFLNIGTAIISTLPNIYEHNLVSWFPAIGITYILGISFFMVKSIFQLIQIEQLKKSAEYELSDFFIKKIPLELNPFKNTIRVGVTNRINTPLTFGWLDPIILLPLSICNQLTPKEIETILIHEMAHILRNDYVINLFLNIIQALLFFNPIALLMNKEISLQREMACDAYVVQSSEQKLNYMNALVKLAQQLQTKASPNLSMGIFTNKSELLKRVQYFNQINIKSAPSTIIKLGIAFLLTSLLLISIPDSQNKKNPLDSYNKINQNNKVTEATSSRKVKIEKTDKSRQLGKIEVKKHHHDLQNESYASLVKQTMQWLKSHEANGKLTAYNDQNQNDSYSIADRLMIRAIISNYQLKRDLLNKKLSKTSTVKEAIDILLNSEELEQIKQFEIWTKEFLQAHPTTIDVKEDSLIVY